MSRAAGLGAVVAGSLIMAAVSTFADAFWAAAIPEHRAAYGLVHGGLVLSTLGFTLAWLVGSTRRFLAAMAGLFTGIAAAGLFYVLYPFVGIVAMVLAWMGLWVAFAFLTETVAPDREATARTTVRGLAAAVASGIAFWSISGIWLGDVDPGPLYLRNFAHWCIAFLPGMAALLLWRPEKS